MSYTDHRSLAYDAETGLMYFVGDGSLYEVSGGTAFEQLDGSPPDSWNLSLVGDFGGSGVLFSGSHQVSSPTPGGGSVRVGGL